MESKFVRRSRKTTRSWGQALEHRIKITALPRCTVVRPAPRAQDGPELHWCIRWLTLQASTKDIICSPHPYSVLILLPDGASDDVLSYRIKMAQGPLNCPFPFQSIRSRLLSVKRPILRSDLIDFEGSNSGSGVEALLCKRRTVLFYGLY